MFLDIHLICKNLVHLIQNFSVFHKKMKVYEDAKKHSLSLLAVQSSPSEDTSEGKIRVKPETPRNDTCISNGLHSRQSVGETNPLISSYSKNGRYHCKDCSTLGAYWSNGISHAQQSFNMQDSSSVPSKVFRSSYEDKITEEKQGWHLCFSISNTKFSLLDDISEGKTQYLINILVL